MSAAPVLLLGVVGLVGVLAWELGGAAKTPQPAARAVAEGAKPAATSAVPDNTANLAAAILARPLFSPSRRPAVPDAVAEAPQPAAVLPRLTGVLVTSASRSAIFAAEPRATVVQEGGRLGHFTIRSIKPGQVVVVGPDGARQLKPSFDLNRPGPSPVTPFPMAPARIPGLPLLPSSTPPVARGAPPWLFTGLQEGAKDTMPFDQNSAPSGLTILRNTANRATSESPASP